MVPDNLDDAIDIELRMPPVVAARAVALATVVRRGLLEMLPEADPDEIDTACFDLTSWAKVYLSDILEPPEMQFLRRPAGTLTKAEKEACLDAAEALATLRWCLTSRAEPLVSPHLVAPLPAVLSSSPGPWVNPSPFMERAHLRPESEIATERERAEIWWWRAGIDQDAAQDAEVNSVIAEVAKESATATLIDEIDGDLSVDYQPFASIDRDRQATILVVSSNRLRALNWVCGFGPTWKDTPLDLN